LFANPCPQCEILKTPFHTFCAVLAARFLFLTGAATAAVANAFINPALSIAITILKKKI
jgi:hypothetical protein